MAQAIWQLIANFVQVVADDTANTLTFQTYDASSASWVTQWTLNQPTGAVTVAQGQTVTGLLTASGGLTGTGNTGSLTAGTGILDTVNTFTVAQSFSAGVNPNVTVNSLAGTTAGTVYYTQPFAGSGYKKVIVWFDGYEDDTTTGQSFNFPTAFGTVANIVSNDSGLTLTTSLTALSITAPDATTVYSGVAVVEGW